MAAKVQGRVLPEFRRWNLVVFGDVVLTRWVCWVCGCVTTAPVVDGVVEKPARCVHCKAAMPGEAER